MFGIVSPYFSRNLGGRTHIKIKFVETEEEK